MATKDSKTEAKRKSLASGFKRFYRSLGGKKTAK